MTVTVIDPASASSTPRVRLDYLDGLRGLAALFVVVHHAYAEVYDQLPPAVVHATRWLAYAQVAVDVFIVLSGYCLMLPVARDRNERLRGGIRGFFARRARRILPPYYAALVLSLLLTAFVPGMGRPSGTRWDIVLPVFTPGVLLSHLLLLHNLSADWWMKIDYPMWSVATEWDIYFLFALLLLPVWRRFGPGALLLVALTVGMLPHWHHNFHHHVFVASSWFLGLFALGMVGALLGFGADPRLAAWRTRLPWGAIAALLWGGFWVLAQTHETWLATHMWQTDMVVGLAATSLMVYCTRHLTRPNHGPRPLILRLLEARGAVTLGVFSYSLYLIHAPLLALLHLELRRCHLTPIPLLAILELGGVPCALLLSYGFHLAFERPFLNTHKRETLAETARDAALTPTP